MTNGTITGPLFADERVGAAFAAFPEPARQGLLALRALVLQVAADTPEAGRIEEALRWGQPAYLTPETKSGSTLRLGIPRAGGFAIFAHCQTSLIADFRDVVGDRFRYEGNRAVVFTAPEQNDVAALSMLIRRALTWHLRR